MTDLEGLPHEVRYSLFVLRIADRWKKFPSEVEEQDQAMLGHLEHERIVLDALKRHG